MPILDMLGINVIISVDYLQLALINGLYELTKLLLVLLMRIHVVVEPDLAPLGPHDLGLVEVQLHHRLNRSVFVPLDVVPPEALPH